MAPRTPNLKSQPISEWFPKNLDKDLQSAIQDATKLIQKLHFVPHRDHLSLPTRSGNKILSVIPFGGVNVESFEKGHYGQYVSIAESIRQQFDHPGAYMYINTHSGNPFFTAVHEIFHMMYQEFWARGSRVGFSYDRNIAFRGSVEDEYLRLELSLMQTRKVRKSNQTWRKLIVRHEVIARMHDQGSTRISNEDFEKSELTSESAKYLSSPEEWMARAYAQAVTLRSLEKSHRDAMRSVYRTRCFSCPSNLSPWGVWIHRYRLKHFIRRIGWNV